MDDLIYETSPVRASDIGKTETGDSNFARLNKLRDGDTLVATVCRFDPSKDKEPRYERFEVPYSKWMRVLDVLEYINEDLGVGLGYRWLCGVKKCGTCAVRMNGREVLACWEAAEPEMVIEPLRHAPLVRDLVVDRSDYEGRVMAMMPWMERLDSYQGFPEPLSHRDMRSANTAMHCLSCMACLSACPVLDLGDETNFAGPAPLVQLAQRALDPRDGMDRGRVAALQANVFACVSCYKCEEVCPAEIPIVSGVIEPLKRQAYLSLPQEAKHAVAFRDIVLRRGRIDPSALILKTQGLKALLRLGRIWRLWRYRKIDPVRTFFGGKGAVGREIARLGREGKE